MIQMMQGHALTILSEMPRDCLFDAVITDPPYASGAATLSGISAKTSTKYTSSKRGNCPYPDFEGDAMDKRSWANLMLQVLLEARMRTKPGGVIAMFVDWRQTPGFSGSTEYMRSEFCGGFPAHAFCFLTPALTPSIVLKRKDISIWGNFILR